MRPVVGFGPQLGFAARFDELRGDAHAIGFGADGAFDEVVRAQRLADLAHGAVRTLDPRGTTSARSRRGGRRRGGRAA